MDWKKVMVTATLITFIGGAAPALAATQPVTAAPKPVAVKVVKTKAATPAKTAAPIKAAKKVKTVKHVKGVKHAKKIKKATK
jgi:hypothetical protein